MLKKAADLIYFHELPFGLLGLLISFITLLVVPMPVTIWRSIPLGISWISVFFIGDALSRKSGMAPLFPHNPSQLHKLKRLALAGFIMNCISDATGAYMTRLWYYPGFDPVWYFMFFAPVGYMLFGIILFVFYRYFQFRWKRLTQVKAPRKSGAGLFRWLIHIQGAVGIIVFIVSVQYYSALMVRYGVRWYEIFARVEIPVNIVMFVLSWLSVFYILEYVSYLLGRETLTRDISRGNFVPLLSILGASVVCVILTELFNAPFQVWTFNNWPYDSYRLLSIPLVAYLMWPLQYLLLLPILRIIDGKNEEHVW